MKHIDRIMSPIRLERRVSKNDYLERELHWIRFGMQARFGSAPSKDELREYLCSGNCGEGIMTDEQKMYLFRNLLVGLLDHVDDYDHLLEKVLEY